MRILKNEDLSRYTSVRIGGTAETMFVPESSEELAKLIREYPAAIIVGGGSNLLINNRTFEATINLKSFDTTLDYLGGGEFRVGASVHLQKLINTINEHGFGGIEYLFSVPGLVGGAVVMNAGRGKQYNKCISDYILSVDVLKDGEKVTYDKQDCGFEYRNSVFKNSDMIVLSVHFRFPEMSEEESSRLKKERIELCKEKQDNTKPNFGTVFMQSSRFIMRLVRMMKTGGKRVHFSGKTANWLLNEGGGTFEEAMSAIKKVERMHKLLGQKCRREVIVLE